MRLRAARPAFVKALPFIARGHPSTEQMRSYVCAQCHAQYYLAGPQRVVTYPWSKGLKIEEIEACYDEISFSDWNHAETGAPVLKAQHPQFEVWSQGIHARSGVACADCHMPAQRRAAVYLTDHFIRSPLDNIERACLRCHAGPRDRAQARAAAIQDCTARLLSRALDALLDLYDEVRRARQAGAAERQLAQALRLQRKAQFRLDFVQADGSKGFHAAQETARILAEAIDYARQGQLAAAAR
jgi:nitrite reductase (cytochrome c-552)